MATKKLKVELELDNTKAKRQAKELEQTDGGAGGSGGVSSSADKLAKNLDKAADSAGRMDGSTKQLVRGFTGLAVGLAGSYAASHMKQGAARDAVEYASSGLSGAASGAMMGSVIPGVGTAVGAIVGGLVGGLGGALKTYLEKSSADKQFTEEWRRSERLYRNDKKYANFINSLGSMNEEEKLEAVAKKLEQLKKGESSLLKTIDRNISNKEYDEANKARESLGQNRARQAQLETIMNSPKESEGVRASLGAVDALSRLGGDFTGGGGQGMDIQKEQLDVLRSIDRKTGGAKWR